MLLGLSLLYVGAALILNGLWMLGRISDREITIINLFTGGLILLVCLRLALGPDADATSIRGAAFSLLFAFTYLWVAWNRLTAADGRGLGWFSLFVAITTVPVFLRALAMAGGAFEIWLALNWLIWGVLWFMYFLLLAQGRPILRQTAWVTLISGIVTGWLPGFLLLDGIT